MSTEVTVQPVDSPDDFGQIYHCISEAFGRQTKDSVWIALNGKWDTREGQREGASKLLESWRSAAPNKDGQPNTVFLKATMADPQDNFKRKIVGAAVWSQLSFVEGYGNRPAGQPAAVATLEPTERRFASQMYRSIWERRVSLAREKAPTASPALFTLDTCVVDPAFQRKGVAAKLVAWGLEEARRRGGLECATEASPMGRLVYAKLGFRAEGDARDVEYEVDEEFRCRDKLGVLFMRTGPVGQ